MMNSNNGYDFDMEFLLLCCKNFSSNRVASVMFGCIYSYAFCSN